MVSKKHYVFKTCIFWRCFENVIQVVGFRRWNHYKTNYFSSHAVSPRNNDGFQLEEVHFQKSDIFAMSKREVHRVITSGAQSNHIAPEDLSENHANTIGNVMFSKMVLWLQCFYVFELSKQWKFTAFWARRLEIGSGFQLMQGFLYGPKITDQMYLLLWTSQKRICSSSSLAFPEAYLINFGSPVGSP